MDWSGLLKWSLTQTDGTASKDIQPMDDDTKKWLQEAYESYSFDEIKRMQEIVEVLMQHEDGTPEDEEKKVTILDELDDLVTGLDKAKHFCSIGGMSALIKYMFESRYPEAQIIALRIFTASNQLDAQVQEYCASLGAFQLLTKINDAPIKVKEQMLSALSSLVRGENLSCKRILIDKEGVELTMNTIRSNPESFRIREKGLNLLRDLLQYDGVLNKTYNDLSKFANTNAIPIKSEKGQGTDIRKDPNEELLKHNELPENKHYQHRIKGILLQQGFLDDQFASIILSDLTDRNIDSRVAYLDCLYNFKDQGLEGNVKLIEMLQSHKNKIIQINKESKGFNDVELEFTQRLLA